MADREADNIKAMGRAERFRAWLETEEVDEYFQRTREQMVEAMIKCPLDDDMGRRRLAEATQILDKFKNFLVKGIEAGEIARKDLEEMRRGKRPFF